MRNLTILKRYSIIHGALLIFALVTTNQAFSAESVNRYRSHYKAAILADAESGRI
ncbi:MAG TPA: D-alanyl-D-alanine carboxypeptidase, partial [Deltaproteobacteria bacterium]|nr:D-alanyl-D-alanine carboxypeptidase [Deltaproteobacteria bacterium]